MLFGYNITIKQIILGLILIYIAVDTVVFLFNGIQHTGPGGCATDDWFSGPFILNNSKKPVTCPENVVTDGLNTIGKWREYALKNDKGERLPYLYEAQVDNVVKDIKDNYVIEGFTPVQLLAMVIIPVVIIESIGFWLLSTQASKAEWTFWIVLITLIYTGLRTLVKETADIDISPPSETSCLTYLTDKLGFNTGDELQYNFMARKQDGKNCMIEGTFLGSPDGGIEPEDQPTIYRGDISACSSSNLPLY